MFGAIAGDMIGSVYEGKKAPGIDFLLFQEKSTFTDDTVLTVAVADAILSNLDYAKSIRKFARRYPNAGYGGMFIKWFTSDDMGPYNSFGNGSAMRVSPLGWAYETVKEVLKESRKSAGVTHNHPAGIRGAQATAAAIFLARNGNSKEEIKSWISSNFGYNLNRSLAILTPLHYFDATCQGSVPNALIAFMESSDFEDCIRKTIAMGGDTDTQAAIAGGIAEAFYGGVPGSIKEQVFKRLDQELIDIINKFYDIHVSYGLR